MQHSQFNVSCHFLSCIVCDCALRTFETRNMNLSAPPAEQGSGEAPPNYGSLYHLPGGQATTPKKSVGLIDTAHTALLLCNFQERVKNRLGIGNEGQAENKRLAQIYWSSTLNNSKILLSVANIMKIPVFSTQQYPAEPSDATVLDLGLTGLNCLYTKTGCSMFSVPQIRQGVLENSNIKSVILRGWQIHLGNVQR